MNLFVLDFETTGLNPYQDDIIEMAVKKIGDDDIFERIVIPKKMPKGSLYTYVPPHIVKLTGITDKMIKEKGIDKNVGIQHMFQYILKNSNLDENIYIISHNGTVFDFIFFKRLLTNYIQKVGIGVDKDIFKNIKYLDTLLFSKSFLNLKSYSQKNICSNYNIENKSEHRALGDIIALEKMFICLCKDFSKKNNKDDTYYISNINEINLYV